MKFAISDMYPKIKVMGLGVFAMIPSFQRAISHHVRSVYISGVLSQLNQIMSSKTQLLHPYASKAHSSNRPKVPKDARKRVASAYHWKLSVIS